MKERIPYYRVKRSGFGYWEPSRDMRELGFVAVACGPDGEDARAKARKLVAAWEECRKSSGRQALAADIEQILQNRKPKTSAADCGYVYFFKVGNFIKIGFSKRPIARAQELHVGQSADADMFFAVRGKRADEKAIHHQLSACRSRGEWFEATPSVMATIARCMMAGRAVHTAIKTSTNSRHYGANATGGAR